MQFFLIFKKNGLCDGCVFSNVSKYNYCFSDFPFPEGANDYPHHTEMAQYIVDYAQHFKLPEIVHFRTHVVSITQKGQLLPHKSCQHHTKRSVASAPKLSASHKKVSDFCTKDVSITHKGQLLLHPSCQHHIKRSVTSAPKMSASHKKVSCFHKHFQHHSHSKEGCFHTQVVSITQKGQLLLHQSYQHNAKRSVASAPLTLLTACLLQHRSRSKVGCFYTQAVSITQKGQWRPHQSCQHHAKKWSVAFTPKLSASCRKVSLKLSASLTHQVGCFHTNVVSITQKGHLLPH